MRERGELLFFINNGSEAHQSLDRLREEDLVQLIALAHELLQSARPSRGLRVVRS